MRTIKNFVKPGYLADQRIKSIVAVPKSLPLSTIVDDFDLLLLIIAEGMNLTHHNVHYIKDGIRIQERWVDPCGIEQWVVSGENRNIIQWILQGEIVLDRQAYLTDLRDELMEFPRRMRDRRLFMEYSLFTRRCLQSKQYLQDGDLLDAYTNIVEAIQHWARIEIIELGLHPEVMVWKQVYKINPGVFKLYEELTSNEETLEQRIRLCVLACEFSVFSKMAECCQILIDVIGSREKPWSLLELKKHEYLEGLHVELNLILTRLVKKSFIKEVLVPLDVQSDIVELQYKI